VRHRLLWQASPARSLPSTSRRSGSEVHGWSPPTRHLSPSVQAARRRRGWTDRALPGMVACAIQVPA
jgi:hypothetical protein